VKSVCEKGEGERGEWEEESCRTEDNKNRVRIACKRYRRGGRKEKGEAVMVE